MNDYTDQEIIEEIRKGGRDREQITYYLLKKWNGYNVKLANKYHLTPLQQKDAYTDAIVKLISQIDQGQFKGNSALSTYFYSILNNGCIDVLRSSTSNKNKPTEVLNEWTSAEHQAFDLIGKKDLLSNVKYVIGQMGESCKNVLMDWGFYGYNMKEIVERRQLASPESARSVKYKCLKKLKELLAINDVE